MTAESRRRGAVPVGPVGPGAMLLAVGAVFVLGLLLGFVLGRTV